MTTIKITQLTDIGANLATSTVLPVVNMAGTPTTQKTTVGNIANLALSQAGNSYPAAAQAVLAQTVTNTAQPNITSVGTLTGLTVSGNASINGNIISNGTAYLGNISTTGSASITTLSVGATSNLGAVGNITITGGSNGQVLTTAGNGSLSWTTATLSGDGGNISNIAGANVTGTVGNANLAQFIDVSDVNNNFSYHVVLSAGSGDKSVHIDADDNLQYNPADGILTAVRVDATYVVADLQFSNGYPLSNVTGVGNIASINLTGSNSNVLYGNGVFAPVSGGGNPFDQDLNTTDNVQFANITSTDAIRFENAGNLVGALGYAPTHIGIESYGSNSVYITTNDFNTWAFNGDGTLSLPGNVAGESGNVLIDSADDNFEVRGAQAVNFEANTVVNIYADASNNAYQWQFGDDGNLTLPDNSSSINYANGTPYGGGGGSGYIIPYTVDTFVANTKPGFGEIQFADNEGANSAPATAQKLFINESPTNEQSLGTIFQQWTSNSYRGTLSLNNGSDSQATFNISNGRIYFEPETYRGFKAGLNQIWGDDCSINQLIITNASAPNFYNTDFLVEDDVFHASGLATGNTHVMLNIYGSSQYNPINVNDLWNTFVAFVDNVLYDNTTLRTNPDDIKTQFYNNTGSFRNNIPTQDLFQYFRFTQSSGADYFGTAPTTTNGSGTGATVRIRVNPNNTYTVLGTALPGVGYIGGETLTVLGTDLGGASPANDLTILIDSVDGDGVITAVSYDSGTGVYPWPTNSISDGSDDQYDTGNYLNTNLASEISYANGITQTASAAFGGGNYCVMYYQSFFCMVATGVSSSVSDLFYSGNLGFDGDGDLNWTGLRSNQDVVANNNALYAYFDSEYLDGELTPTVGTTYNMVLDSAGINLDGFYAYNDTNTGDYFFGRNTDWRVESQSQLYVQSYNEMIIQTLVNQRGIGETGPALTVQAGDGSPGQQEINAGAGNGGTVYVRGGDAGSSDGIDSLGNTGGRVEISGGVGSGNSQAGNVEINGGEGNNSGSINLRTDYGSNSTGKITLNTGGNGTTNTWEFRPDGSTIYPTLTVTRGDRTGTLTGQTILFGNSTQEAILTTSNGTSDINDSQRLVINPGAGYANTTGEGGDIYLYAGRGGDAGGSGGDIKIRGGLGPVDGHGGYIDINGGEAAGNGPGGYIEIFGGQSANNLGGEVRIEGGQGGTTGGNANLRGGYGQTAGGNVNIWGGGSANGQANEGLVNIQTGGNTWTFAPNGNLTLPGNTFAVNYANGTQVNIGGGGGGNTGNVTFDDVTVQGVNQLNLSAGPDYTANLAYLQVRAGDVASHIHFDTGNNEAYDLIVGNDSKYVQVSSTGNIIMSSYDGNTSYTMKLDTTGNVTFPGVLGVAGGTATAVPVTNESGIPGGQGGSVITGTVADNPDIASVQPGWTVTGNNLTTTTTVTSVVESSPNFYTITTDTIEEGPFTYNEVYTFTSPGISNWVFANDNTLTFPRDEIANTDPYLRIESGSNPRILSEDASLAGPANLEITALNTIFTGSTGSEIRIYPDDGEIGSTGNLQLWANAGSNVAQYSWTFDTTGNLTTPSNLVISASGIGTGTAIAQTDAPLQIASTDANGSASIGWYGNPTGPGNVVQVALNQTGGSMTVVTGDYSDTTYVWDFNNTGNLTLPTGGELHATGKIGYTSGGTATQSGTGQGVTLNQLTGQITLAKSSWNVGDTEVFNISCNKIANADYVMAQVINGSEASYFNTVAYPFTAVANSIRVQVTAVVASTATPVVQFLIMKAATS